MMTNFITSRREILGLLGAGAMSAVLPRGAAAEEGAAAPLAFGYQNTSWGVIGMIAEAEDMFKKAGAERHDLQIRRRQDHPRRHGRGPGRYRRVRLDAADVVGAAKGEVAAIGMAMYAGKTLAVVAGANQRPHERRAS